MRAPGPLYVIAAATLAAAAYVWWKNSQTTTADTTGDGTGTGSGSSTGFFTGLADNMTSAVQNAFTDPAAALANSNVQAFLAMVRTTETGTAGPDSYTTIAGGGHVSSLAAYPTIGTTLTINGRQVPTHAVGGYQFMPATWNDAAAALGLTDFSAASQDLAACWLIKRRGAIADVQNGDIVTAIQKCNKEWASLPGSPYNQNPVPQSTAETLFAQYGGVQADAGALV